MSKMKSAEVDTDAHTVHSWPRHQMASSLRGDRTLTCSEVMKSQARFSWEFDFHNCLDDYAGGGL